jgi:ribulose-5-phosphate 4-epimerase/fuculose-1-phosphate aldolase
MTDTQYRTQLVELGASLFTRGYSVGGAGNISLLLPDGTIMATPTNSCLGRLCPRELSVVDMEGRLLRGCAPTKELPLHMAAYRAKPNCKAVVHLHSTYVTALSSLADVNPDNVLPPFTPYYVMKIGRLPMLPYHKPGAPELGDALTGVAGSGNAFLLANHGCVVCGGSLAEAVNNAEELEETAKVYFVLLSSGRPVRYFSEEEIAGLAPAKSVPA